MLGAEFEFVREFLSGLDCYSKVAGFEAAVDIFVVYPNARLIGAFTLEDDGVVVNSRVASIAVA